MSHVHDVRRLVVVEESDNDMYDDIDLAPVYVIVVRVPDITILFQVNWHSFQVPAA